MHGYSSSEESEDPKRPRPLPASSSNTTDQKKRKKKKPAPQQAINRIWKKLQARKPTTPLAVLPFDPVAPPASPERANEASDAGYERAVDECRRKVRKIIKECRRVNMRYRDQGWDLDWDLKMEKGHCLNHLGDDTFDVSYPPPSSATLPKSVKRVHQIFEKPTFLETINSSEVIQGSLGNCWAVAALSALADVDDGIKRLCVEYDTRVGIYGFVFYRDNEWVYSIVDDKLHLKSPDWDSPSLQRQLLSQIDREDVEQHYRKTYQTGSKALFFGKNKDQNETWLPLLEKAYSKAHGDYSSMIGGWIGECLEDMTGGVTTELLSSDILDLDSFWDDELSKVNQEFMFGCSTGLLDGGYGSRDGITERHAYVVMDARTLKSGQRLVKLRNPWGKLRKGVWEGAYADGSKEWTADVQKELGHSFGSDSVFWIPYEDMLGKYLHIDRTRLFRDRGWRCCQRWIGVDVPWKPDYHEKFHIKLTRDSPLILVLSQLDRRYFKGLEGQYNFRLNFRVHETGRPGAEDYVVRSHGNYLMTRSVSIEIPDMPAGEYTVYLLVTAERYTSRPSVEDVVRRECKRRKQNEKLAQVGYAYDLAHSKAHHHLEKVKEMRKAADHSKASGSRQHERRKQWERRRADREIKRKQAKKNGDKKARLIAERETKKEATASESSSEAEAEAADKKTDDTSSDKHVVEPAGCQEKPADDKPEEKPAEEKSTDNKPEEKSSEDKPADAEEKTSAEGKPTEAVADNETTADKSAEKKPADKDSEPKKSGGALGNTQAEPELEEAKEAVLEKDKQPKPEPKPTTAAEPSKSAPKSKDSKKSKTAKSAKPATPAPAPEPIDYSSDSPVEEWEAIYSSDDFIRKPRTQPIPDVTADDIYPSEDEKLPDPWNAVCIVGFKVYSKDEDLELRVIMEGGALEEGGMGAKGERDLDNAQENAAGGREDEEKGEKGPGYEPIVVKEKGTGQTEDEDGDDESEGDGTEKPKRKKKTRKPKDEVEGEAKTEDAQAKKADESGESKTPEPHDKDKTSKTEENQETPKSKDEQDTSETKPDEQDKPAETNSADDKKDEVTEKLSDAEVYRKKLEEMRKMEELMRKREAELKAKEEAFRKREEEMKKQAEKGGKGEEEEYVDCENTSSSGMSTPDTTPFQEVNKEILG